MNGVQINEYNAGQYNDCYRVSDADGLNYWMEHNQQEAEALAAWLWGNSGVRYYVTKIPIDTMRFAQTIRPTPARHPHRDEAFRDMGIV